MTRDEAQQLIEQSTRGQGHDFARNLANALNVLGLLKDAKPEQLQTETAKAQK